jgi:hypothetical protein
MLECLVDDRSRGNSVRAGCGNSAHRRKKVQSRCGVATGVGSVISPVGTAGATGRTLIRAPQSGIFIEAASEDERVLLTLFCFSIDRLKPRRVKFGQGHVLCGIGLDFYERTNQRRSISG